MAFAGGGHCGLPPGGGRPAAGPAGPGAPAEDGRLYEDAEGTLPRPWVAFRKPEPPDQGACYYYNLETSETQWDRPAVRVQRTPGHPPRQLFASWQDHRSRDFARAATGCEAQTLFRDFCVRLWPRGVFSRLGDGLLWRFGEAERVGLALQPLRRRVALAYDTRAVPRDELRVADSADPGAVASPAGALSLGARAVALELALRALQANTPVAALLVDPKAHSVRRYLAELDGATSRPLGAPSPHAAGLVRHLRSSGSLLGPFSCRLTGVQDLRDEVELAVHLLSGLHQQCRRHLRDALRRLEQIDSGEVSLGAWLPDHAEEYRSTAQWAERRFQDFPAADGCVLRFDHLLGRGARTPTSSWFAARSVPLALVAPSAPDGLGSSGSSGSLWASSQHGSGQRLNAGSSVDELLLAVRRSLQDGAHAVRAAARLEGHEQQWKQLRHSSGHDYYYNCSTGQTMWERPLTIHVGESWATHPETRAQDTPPHVFHRIHPCPQRPVPT